jgi:hypothetical protein
MMRKAVLLLCILALGILFLLGGCKAPEEEVVAPEAEVEVPAAEAEEGLPAAVEQEVAAGAWLAGVACADNKVSAVITNQEGREMTIVKDIKILIRGLVVTRPDCDKMTLAPGESAICDDISGGFPLAASNIIILRAPDGVQEEATAVCE